MNAASSEQALIGLYEENSVTTVNSSSTNDPVSNEIIKLYQPRAHFGDESFHFLLRLKSAIEIILNKSAIEIILNRRYYDRNLRS